MRRVAFMPWGAELTLVEEALAALLRMVDGKMLLLNVISVRDGIEYRGRNRHDLAPSKVVLVHSRGTGNPSLHFIGLDKVDCGAVGALGEEGSGGELRPNVDEGSPRLDHDVIPTAEQLIEGIRVRDLTANPSIH
jgi:hypothetical protein